MRQIEKDYRQRRARNSTSVSKSAIKRSKNGRRPTTEAATVARTKDAERAKFEGESNTYKASTKACTEKNKQLVKVGRDLLVQYEGVTLGDALLAREPVTGIKRARVKSLLEDYDEKIETQKVQAQKAQR